jgi:rSAM/selenodomain-associated transferase 1
MPAPQTVLFVRAPRRGTVKTRLARSLGDDNALEAYRTLLTVTSDALHGLGNVELRVTPDDGIPELEPWRQTGWTLAPQGTGSLGERLAAAVEIHFRNGATSVVIIGSDCPDITAQDIHNAHQALATSDVVLGPASDGGYWLIGLRRPTVGVFDNIAWSTETVLQQTLERAAALGLSVATLRQLDDIDTHEDWLRWVGRKV